MDLVGSELNCDVHKDLRIDTKKLQIKCNGGGFGTNPLSLYKYKTT